MGSYTRETVIKRITEAMEAGGFSQRGVAIEAGLTADTLRDFFRGKTHMLRADKLAAIFRVLGLELEEHVPLAGTITKGGKVLSSYSIQPNQLSEPEHTGTPMVSAPPSTAPGGLIAFRVEDDSMQPFMPAGTLVYCRNSTDKTMDELVDVLCMVAQEDNMLLRTLKRGYSFGCYNLLAYNAAISEDVPVKWALPVEYIRLPQK